MTDHPAVSSDRWFRMLAERTGDVFYCLRIEPDQAVEYISDTVSRWGGYTAEDYMSDPSLLSSILDPRDAAVVAETFAAEFDRDLTFVFRWTHRDGRPVWTQNVARKRRRDDGSVVLEGTAHDITDLRQAQQDLERSQEEYRLLAEQSSDFTLRTVEDFTVEWVSPSVTKVLGWLPEEVVGRNGVEFFHPHDVAGTLEQAASMATGASAAGRIRLRCADGSYRWVSQVARPVFDSEGTLIARISGFQDVDAQVRAEQALARSERQFRLAMESAPTGMAVVSLDRIFTEVNPALCRMLRRAEDWLLHRSVAEILDPEDDDLDRTMRAEVLSGVKTASRRKKRLVTADGDRLWVEHSLGLLTDDEGTPLSFVSQFLDVTAAHQAEERLRYLAGHDALTSLANRHQLLTRVAAILLHRPRTGNRLAVLFVDLDKFKPINDTYGHAAGDAVLVEVASRIAATVRSDDVVGRIGGDEFIVALPAVHNVDDAVAVASKLRDAISAPIEVGPAQVSVGVSIGVTLAQPDDDADSVLQRADEALYVAKSTGRNRTVVRTPSE